MTIDLTSFETDKVLIALDMTAEKYEKINGVWANEFRLLYVKICEQTKKGVNYYE